ncbi:protein translocase SEC61 complex subunit gamma [Candidatus Pacearchaeota archaeon]|nr:protein translocase SEC61 complex subunit gamma [Candidatus Pacearchaeota archaeon]
MINKLNSFFKQCVRVWQLLKKPDKKEFTTVAKISAIGLLLVGVIGFVIAMIMGYFGLS